MQIKERFKQLKNRQAKDWWTATFGDPVSWWVLSLIGDVKWITPTGLTLFSFLCKMIPAGLILTNDRSYIITAAILLQIGQVLDSMDGNLARYRKATSIAGGFLDRILDGVGFIFIQAAVSYYIYINGGAFYYLILGPVSAAFYLVVCYIYWSVAFEELKFHMDIEKVQPGKNIKSLKDIPTWLYILQGQKKLFNFNQADFYFWIGLGLLIQKPEFSIWLLFIILSKKMTSRILKRYKKLKKLDMGNQG